MRPRVDRGVVLLVGRGGGGGRVLCLVADGGEGRVRVQRELLQVLQDNKFKLREFKVRELSYSPHLLHAGFGRQRGVLHLLLLLLLLEVGLQLLRVLVLVLLLVEGLRGDSAVS